MQKILILAAILGTASPLVTSRAEEPALMEEVVVSGRSDSMIGIADSANEGVVGREQLALRPLLRPADLVETVPGVIVSQHSGSGKANQYYLRGFNLDHGTDLSIGVDGIPVNMRSHAHGQGYSDLNFVIPEFVDEVKYEKGTYYPEKGDFSSAGAFDMSLINKLERGFLTLEGGTDGYSRLVLGQSLKVGPGTLLYGLELYHNDGPWKRPDDYQKLNALVRYSQGDNSRGFTITGMAYHGDWNSTDQVAQRAVNSGFIDRFGNLDSSDGGDTSRYSITGEWHRADEDSATKLQVYGLYYDLDLFSNFTYFLDDPIHGDQFEQQDRRIHWGGSASHTLFGNLFGFKTENTFGLQFRQDNIRNGLYHTESRDRLSTARADHILETSIGAYYGNKTHWTDWFRTEAGIRADEFFFDVDNYLPENSGSKDAFIASPKLSLIFGPWKKTELYLNGGLGFHSNDARGVTTNVDPATGDRLTPADPLVRTKGAEVGIRTTIIPGLQSSLTFWMLDIDSELLFIGDAGTTEASRPSQRIGFESANYYNITPWLTVDADFAISQARFTGNAPEGQRIPGSIASVLAAGISVHDLPGIFHPWSASLRYRYFGPRDLVENGGVTSSATALFNAQVRYTFNERWSAALEVFNIFDQQASDIDYFYTSRLRGEAAEGVDDIHFHPTEPRQIRLSVTAKF